jgi:hypothetical protein
MSRLFAILTILNLLLLVTALAVGYGVATHGWLHAHVLSGVIAALLSVLVQCICFTYFLGTGRWVTEATRAHKLDLGYYRRSRNLKRSATFHTLGGFVAILIVAGFGGAVLAVVTGVRPWMHGAAAWVGVIVYGLICWGEIRLIRLNLDMLDKLVAAVNRSQMDER